MFFWGAFPLFLDACHYSFTVYFQMWTMKRSCYPRTDLYAQVCVCVHNDCVVRLDVTKWKLKELSKKENKNL